MDGFSVACFAGVRYAAIKPINSKAAIYRGVINVGRLGWVSSSKVLVVSVVTPFLLALQIKVLGLSG